MIFAKELQTLKNQKIDKYDLLLSAQALVICFAIGLIFYQSFIAGILLSPFMFLYVKNKKKEKHERLRRIARIQFKELLYNMAASISAGKSPDIAFVEASKDLELLYENKDNIIVNESKNVIKKLELNIPIECAMENYLAKYNIEDVTSFVSALSICKKAGGNLAEVTKNSINAITEKLEVLEEIEITLSQKKFEQKMMMMMPIIIILVLSMLAGDYMAPLFKGIGRVIMTVVLGMILFSKWMAAKICLIRI